MFVSLVTLYGCAETSKDTEKSNETENSSKSEENEVVNAAKKINSIEELNNNFFSLKGEIKEVHLETAYANFDFPIYENDGSGLLALGNSKEYYAYKNDQISEIIDVFGEFDLSTKKYTPKAYYLVTGFYDDNDPLYKEIVEKYADVTYEETADTQSAHWVTSDGLYHRFIVLGSNVVSKEELLKDATIEKNKYENHVEQAPVLPAYFVVSAIESVREETGVNITHSYTTSGGINEWGTGYIIVPTETSNGQAIEIGNKILSKTFELLKNSPMYQDELWKDYKFTIEMEYKDIDTIFLTGYKNGMDTLEWHDILGNIISDGEIVTTSTTTYTRSDVHTLADQYISKVSSKYDAGIGREDIFKVNIDNDEFPEIFSLEMLSNGFSEISVLKYNFQTEQWEKIYSDMSHKHYDGLDALTVLGVAHWLTDNEEQYVFLGRVSGSGGYLSFFVLGSDHNGNVKVVLDRMDAQHHYGELLIDDLSVKKVFVKSDGEVVETITIEDLRNGR